MQSKPRVSASLTFSIVAFASLLGGACGGTGTTGAPAASSGPNQPCARVAGSHHAVIVVQHGNGSVVKGCAGFDGPEVKAEDAMKKSGIGYQTQSFSFGLGVCQVDREPAKFDKCLPPGAPYWALWVSRSGAGFQPAETGISGLTVKDGDELGWRYTPPTESSPAPPPLASR